MELPVSCVFCSGLQITDHLHLALAWRPLCSAELSEQSPILAACLSRLDLAVLRVLDPLLASRLGMGLRLPLAVGAVSRSARPLRGCRQPWLPRRRC